MSGSAEARLGSSAITDYIKKIPLNLISKIHKAKLNTYDNKELFDENNSE